MRSLITLTKKAFTQCSNIIKNSNSKALRLSLRGGGCNGFEYKFETTNSEIKKGDEKLIKDGIEIHICGKSLLYLLGTNIDYKKDIMGQTFHFNNPNAGSTCGCGSSFNPKE